MNRQGVRIKAPGAHGTEYAYRQHLRRGEKPCTECLTYNRERMRAYRLQRHLRERAA